MTTAELKAVGAKLTTEDLGDVLDGFFHARHRVGDLALIVEARRPDTYSIVERIDYATVS